MSRNRRSLSVTDAYRERMVALRERAEVAARDTWGHVRFDDLNATYRKDVLEGVLAALQRRGVILSTAYLSAFTRSELGHQVATPKVDARLYAGFSRSGQPLDHALQAPLIATKAAITAGDPDPLKVGLERLVRQVSLDMDHATRESLADLIQADARIAGWRRAVRGTCGACLGKADDGLVPPHLPLRIHPNCQCVSEPVLKNVPDRFPRPSGSEIFKGLSRAAKIAAVGATAAAAVDAGDIELKDLVAISVLATQPDFVTQRPDADIPQG